jgi:hypothetical protein
VYYCGVCIFVWEDKNLDYGFTKRENVGLPKTNHKKKIFGDGDKCQLLAEMKGFAEAFKANVLREPPIFFGVLTSGLYFTFCRRDFIPSTGLASFKLFNPIFGSENNDCLTAITKLLIYSIGQSAVLIDLIEDCLLKPGIKKLSLTYDGNEKDDSNPSKEPDDDFDTSSSDDEIQPRLLSPKKASKSQPSALRSTNTKQGTSGSDAHLKGKSRNRVPLATIHPNNLLNRENLYKLQEILEFHSL